MHGQSTAERLRAEIKTHAATARDLATKATAAGRDFTPDERRAVDAALGEVNRLKADLEAVETGDAIRADLDRLDAEVRGEFHPGKAKGPHPWTRAMVENLSRTGAKALTPSGSITVPADQPGIVTLGDRPTSILNRLPIVPLDGTDSFSYLRETAREHGATTVAKGKTKPRATYSLERVDGRVRTIAHISEPIDRADLADVELLDQYLAGSLAQGVALELENQVLNGNESTAGNLDDMVGILHTPGLGEQEFSVDTVTTARKAVTAIENLNQPLAAVAWLLSPGDWETFELLTDTDHYVLGDPGTPGQSVPVDRARRQLWSYPVVTSTLMPSGTALLGDWSSSNVRLYAREGIRVDWTEAPVVGTEGDDDTPVSAFERNQMLFRAEGRWGLGVLRPAAFIAVELDDGGS